jgi:hypothetical protein
MSVAHVIMPSEVDPLAEKIAAMVIKKVIELKSIEDPLTKEGAAKYLHIALSTLNKRLANGDIPSKYIHRNGGTPYFFASELETLLKKNQ